MSKANLVAAIVANGDGSITKTTAGKLVESCFSAIREGLKTNGRFALPTIGTLSVIQASARESRNPRTGAKVSVPARKKVKFSESSEMKSFASGCKVA